jgi:hypothetical protein
MKVSIVQAILTGWLLLIVEVVLSVPEGCCTAIERGWVWKRGCRAGWAGLRRESRIHAAAERLTWMSTYNPAPSERDQDALS